MDSVQTAIALIENESASFVIVDQGKIVYQDLGIGVSCIMKLINAQSTLLDGTIIVDKVIGKAAAMLLIKHNVLYVYGLLMSVSAIEVFEAHRVDYSYKKKVEAIMNRQNTDLCPLEKSVLTINDLDEALVAIKATIEKLMQNK